jgi:biopolymer transport protein ExbD
MASPKLIAASRDDLEDIQQDMSPMIDLVFLLLIFFMTASTLIVNRLDPAVTPPVADKAIPPTIGAGRIVVNIRADGTFIDEGAKELADMDAITTYVRENDLINERNSVRSRLVLRGDRDAIVRYSKQVVKAAGDAGVNEIIFATYQISRE